MAKNWIDKIRDAFKTGDAAAMEEAVKDAEGVMSKTGNPGENESDNHTHVHVHLETTKPAGNLPETGETEVTSAKDGMVGGEADATFGGKTFFADKALDEAFKSEITGIKDSITKLCDSFEEFKKEAGEKKTEDELAAEAKSAGTMVDAAAKEEADKEIEGALKEEAPPGTSDAHKARDSVFLEDSFAKTAAMAEILVPGILIPTFDRAADPKASYGNMCAFRKKTLTAFGATADGAALLASVAPNLTLDLAKCIDVTTAFRAAAAKQAEKNKTAVMGTNDGSYFTKQAGAAPAPKSMADVQRANDAYWAAQQRAAE